MNKKDKIRAMFDAIASKYDFLNRFLSFGLDIYWRKKCLKLIAPIQSKNILDAACGTGDFSIEAIKQGAKSIFGCDLSLTMLKLFNQKTPLSKGRLIQSIAENLPYKKESFDLALVAFGVRNFFNIEKAFQSFYSILKNNGKAVILEFGLPQNKFISFFYKFYFLNILPKIGAIISGNKTAYSYLPESVKEFNKNTNLYRELRRAGFNKINKFEITFGAVQIFIAEKN